MKVKDVPKYTTVDTVMQLTPRQRQILYRQCQGGRSCYLQDVNYNSGGFYESCFDYRGVFRGSFVTDEYDCKTLSLTEKAFSTIAVKNVDVGCLRNCESAKEYNKAKGYVSKYALTNKEFSEINEALQF